MIGWMPALAALAELQGREQIGPVGDRDRRHARALDLLEQLGDPNRALQQGVAGANPEMDKRGVTQGQLPHARQGKLCQLAAALNRFTGRAMPLAHAV